MVSVTESVSVMVVLPSGFASRWTAYSTAKMCLHLTPLLSWSGQVQLGFSGSRKTAYLP